MNIAFGFMLGKCDRLLLQLVLSVVGEMQLLRGACFWPFFTRLRLLLTVCVLSCGPVFCLGSC